MEDEEEGAFVAIEEGEGGGESTQRESVPRRSVSELGSRIASSPPLLTAALRRCHSSLVLKRHRPLLRRTLSLPHFPDIMAANGYIVVFNDEVTSDQIDKYVAEVKNGGGEVNQRFDAILNGFSATIPDKTLESFKSLQGDVIKYIEPDQVVTTQ